MPEADAPDWPERVVAVHLESDWSEQRYVTLQECAQGFRDLENMTVLETREYEPADDGGPEPYRHVVPIAEHPIPTDQDELDERWPEEVDPEPPNVREVHEDLTYTIAKLDPWHVFRSPYPFGAGGDVYVWNRDFGSGFRFVDEEGAWHQFVNLLAEIVDEEGDCRDAEISSSLLPSGAQRYSCSECGGTW